MTGITGGFAFWFGAFMSHALFRTKVVLVAVTTVVWLARKVATSAAGLVHRLGHGEGFKLHLAHATGFLADAFWLVLHDADSRGKLSWDAVMCDTRAASASDVLGSAGRLLRKSDASFHA